MKSSIGKHLRIAGNIKPYDDLTPENACGKIKVWHLFFPRDVLVNTKHPRHSNPYNLLLWYIYYIYLHLVRFLW